MNWDAIAFDWNQIRGFLATVEEGSLSAAARALGLTQPTLSRQVAALESALGVVLFERLGRNVVPTPIALDLIEHVRAMGEAASRISLVSSGHSQEVEGMVRITASDMISAYYLPPLVARIRAEQPGIEIEVIAANDIRDLQHREADIALRHVRPDQPELIARLIRTEVAHFYATTRYLDQNGRPFSAADLADHVIISPGEPTMMIDYMKALGLELKAETFKIRSEDGIVAWQLLRQDLGITPMSDRIASITPGVEKVMPDRTRVEFPIWLTTHRELHTSRRIRIVFDILAQEFTDGPNLTAL